MITHWVDSEVIELLESACTVVPNCGRDSLPRAAILERARDAEALMAFMPDHIDAAFLDACPRLKVIAAALKGYDNLDAAACSERGVWLSIVPDLLTVPTAELAIGLMIGLARWVPEGDAHLHLLGRETLRHMRRGSYLINVFRGSVVDELAVAEHLATGQLAGYAADVFEMEDWARPDRPETVPRPLLTPHLGSAVAVVRRDIALEAARNILQALSGGQPEGAVNLPRPAVQAAS